MHKLGHALSTLVNKAVANLATTASCAVFVCTCTALCARKWSGFICRRASEDTTDNIELCQLKKEEELEEEMKKNAKSLFFTSRCA